MTDNRRRAHLVDYSRQFAPKNLGRAEIFEGEHQKVAREGPRHWIQGNDGTSVRIGLRRSIGIAISSISPRFTEERFGNVEPVEIQIEVGRGQQELRERLDQVSQR